jgi:N-acetylmuramoyl-L-alanine amidase
LIALALSGSLAIAGDEPITSEKRAARPLVVLDPGHGGSNAGAPSIADGVFEKHVTLALAFEVRRRLQQAGVDVVLTRQRDVYLSLRDRTAIANALSADAFVSIHTNSTEAHSQRGYETYVLTPQALKVDARALRLDVAPRRAGLDRELAAVLDDIERTNAVSLAAELAARIQGELAEALGPEGDRGVRQDAMHVLLGATMPAVLVEVGFIDHPVEGQALLSSAVRGRIAEALAQAVTAELRETGTLR